MHKIKETLDKVIAALKKFFIAFGKKTSEIWKKVSSAVSKAAVLFAKKVAQIWKKVTGALAKAFVVFKKKVAQIWKKVTELWIKIYTPVAKALKKAWKKTSSRAVLIYRRTKESLVQFVKEFNPKDINYIGIILALVLIFLAVLIPITITNREVAEAKEAAAEAARIAYEEARQKALEAEKKAEEERLAALSAALSQEAATAAAEKAAKEAEEKAAKEREELISSINSRIQESVVPSVKQMIDDQTSEDFSTQYSIQEELLDTQEEAVSNYETYVGNLFNKYVDMYIADENYHDMLTDKRQEDLLTSIDGYAENISDYMEETEDKAVNFRNELRQTYVAEKEELAQQYRNTITALQNQYEQVKDAVIEQYTADKTEAAQKEAAEKKAQEEEQLRLEKEALQALLDKYNSHYKRYNRIDLTLTTDSYTLGYQVEPTRWLAIGVKGGIVWNEKQDVLMLGTLGFTFKDTYKGNFGLELAGGETYRLTTNTFIPTFMASAVFRYTIEDGYELAFRPSALVHTDFKTFNIKAAPLTVGVSLTF